MRHSKFWTRIRVFRDHPELKTRKPIRRGKGFGQLLKVIMFPHSGVPIHIPAVPDARVFKPCSRMRKFPLCRRTCFRLKKQTAKKSSRFAFLFAVARLSDILHGNYRSNDRNLPLHRTSSLVSITQYFSNCNRFDNFFSIYFVNVLWTNWGNFGLSLNADKNITNSCAVSACKYNILNYLKSKQSLVSVFDTRDDQSGISSIFTL